MNYKSHGELTFSLKHIAIPAVVGMVGYVLLVTLKDKGSVAMYVAACITATGVFGPIAPMLSWFRFVFQKSYMY